MCKTQLYFDKQTKFIRKPYIPVVHYNLNCQRTETIRSNWQRTGGPGASPNQCYQHLEKHLKTL